MIMMTSRNKDSCTELFKELRILPFYSQYIFALLNLVINNCHFKSNSVTTISISDIIIIIIIIITFHM